jgi:hypothetical protein
MIMPALGPPAIVTLLVPRSKVTTMPRFDNLIAKAHYTVDAIPAQVEARAPSPYHARDGLPFSSSHSAATLVIVGAFAAQGAWHRPGARVGIRASISPPIPPAVGQHLRPPFARTPSVRVNARADRSVLVRGDASPAPSRSAASPVRLRASALGGDGSMQKDPATVDGRAAISMAKATVAVSALPATASTVRRQRRACDKPSTSSNPEDRRDSRPCRVRFGYSNPIRASTIVSCRPRLSRRGRGSLRAGAQYRHQHVEAWKPIAHNQHVPAMATPQAADFHAQSHEFFL